MSRKLRVYWSIWFALALLVTAGGAAYELSSVKVAASLPLVPKEAIEISVFRLLPADLRLSLYFDTVDGQRRPELGEFSNVADSANGALYFPNPGAPVKLLVRHSGKEVIYEALPAGAYGTQIKRDLVPYVENGNPHHVQWSSGNDLSDRLGVGSSTLTVSVIDVGKKILGERVMLHVDSPIDLKHVAANHAFLSWFMPWPLYTLILAWSGFALFRLKKKS